MDSKEECARCSTPVNTCVVSTGTKQGTPRISIGCEDGEEHILLQEQEHGEHYYRTSLATTVSSSSRSSKDSSSMEGHGASDAFTILLNKTGGPFDAAPTRGRSQSDSVASSPAWDTFIPTSTPPSSGANTSRQLPPPPKSFSSSCRRSAPIPAVITSTPTKTTSTSTSTTTLLSSLLPATPLTALSILEEGASPGLLTPGLIQLRQAFPLPPASSNAPRNSDSVTEAVLADMKTPTGTSSSLAMLDSDEQLFFTSYKLPGAFTSFDSLETVVKYEPDRDEDLTVLVEESQQGINPRTPTTPHNRQHPPSNAFSSPGSCSSSSLHSSPQAQQEQQGPSSSSLLFQGESSSRSKRSNNHTNILKNKKSKASIRSNASSSRNEERYMNDWISHDFRSNASPQGRCTSTSASPAHVHASPSRRSVSKDESRQSRDRGEVGTVRRSASRSSWRSRYSTSSTRLDAKEKVGERPETAMSAYTTLTHYTMAETVYEDARDYMSGDEADLEVEDEEEEDGVELVLSPAIHKPALADSDFTTKAASSLSSSSSSISTITGTGTAANTNAEKRSSSSRFRLSFQRRRTGGGGAMSPVDPHFAVNNNAAFRPHSSMSLPLNQSSAAAAAADIARKGSTATPRLSPVDFAGLDTRTTSGYRSENGIASVTSSSAFENRRLSSGLMTAGQRQHQQQRHHRHQRNGSSSSSSYSLPEDYTTATRPTNTDSKEKRSSARISLRPLMLTPEKTRRGSLKDWSVVLLLTAYGSAFVEDFDDGPYQQRATSSAPASAPVCSQHYQDQEHQRQQAMKSLLGDRNTASGAKDAREEKGTNPYAEIYEELAKSPELELEDARSEGALSPLTDALLAEHDGMPVTSSQPTETTLNGLKITHFLEPVAEESSYIESDRDVSGEVADGAVLQPRNVGVEQQEDINTSSTSIQVVAITTDVVPPLSARRQSTESRPRQRRISKPTSLHTPTTSNVSNDIRTRTSSTASSALSRPTTITSTSGNTFNSVEHATVEYGHRLSWQALNGPSERMHLKSPRREDRQEERGFQIQLRKFFQDDEFGPAAIQPSRVASQKGRAGSLPPESNADLPGKKTSLKGSHAVLTRQRTKSQPTKAQKLAPASTLEEDELKTILKNLMPLDAGLRKQAKGAVGLKASKKVAQGIAPAPGNNRDGSSEKHLSTFILGALKKRKSTAELPHARKNEYLHPEKDASVQVPTLSIRDKVISTPLQARHICTGALNAVPGRESPFGRRPSSPVEGYIDVPSVTSRGSAAIKHPLFSIGFDDPACKESKDSAARTTSHSVGYSATSDRSSPSQRSQMSENTHATGSPVFFHSPLSSTCSHSEDGPSTPRAFFAYANNAALEQHLDERYNHSAPADFWAVSFAEAQAGDGDFVAPHATLVKSGKLAMLSTQEKARRRASKASLRV